MLDYQRLITCRLRLSAVVAKPQAAFENFVQGTGGCDDDSAGG
jgi:hypothetical protein